MSTDRIAFDPLQCSDSLVRLMDYWSQQAVLSTGIPRLLIEQPKPVSQAEMMMRIDAAMDRLRDDLVRQYTIGWCKHLEIVRRQHKGFGEPVIAMGRTKQKKQ